MYIPGKHNRQSIRLKGWDYSRPGRYFITVNIQYGQCLLGKIENGKMILNDAGKWPPFEKRFWQKRYWDEIIFNETAYRKIKNYIINNPVN